MRRQCVPGFSSPPTQKSLEMRLSRWSSGQAAKSVWSSIQGCKFGGVKVLLGSQTFWPQLQIWVRTNCSDHPLLQVRSRTSTPILLCLPPLLSSQSLLLPSCRLPVSVWIFSNDFASLTLCLLPPFPSFEDIFKVRFLPFTMCHRQLDQHELN